eukprot:1648878-Pleurochrysis_carterae.AAC.2
MMIEFVEGVSGRFISEARHIAVTLLAATPRPRAFGCFCIVRSYLPYNSAHCAPDSRQPSQIVQTAASEPLIFFRTSAHPD